MNESQRPYTDPVKAPLSAPLLLTLCAACILSSCTIKEEPMPTEPIIERSMEAIVDLDAEPEQLVSGFQFTEGPVWLPDGTLLFSDIPANRIYRWTPGAAQAEVYREPSGHSNGLTLDREGRLIACEHDRRVSRSILSTSVPEARAAQPGSRAEADGSTTTLADRYQGKRLNSPNDIVVKSDGSIYFTDPPYGLPRQEEGRELDYNGVFRLAPDGTLTLLDDTFERPNGLAFSPDERTLYVDDSFKGHIRAFDVLPDGTLANGRVFAELVDPDKAGVPDGMKVDVEGNVFCTGPGGIWVFDPSGRLLGRIVPPEQPANLAWGDADLKTLYITARTGLYRLRTKTGGN